MEILTALQKVQNKENLSADDTQAVFAQIFEENVATEQVRDFLIALYQKTETAEELLGAVRYLRSQGETASCEQKDLIDCCGTGGDQKGTFNISTAVAFVLAGAGCHVAKHGNRAISSRSGSADVLSELGIKITASKETMSSCIDEVGIGFLFAPEFYPLMKKLGPIRKSIPHRTVFNMVGPLLNPAQAKVQLLGVYDKKLMRPMAEVLRELGSHSVVVVHSQDGLDELSLSAANDVVQLKNGDITEFTFDATTSGYPACTLNDLKGGEPKDNAERLKQCLKGHSEPLDHVVHINAAWGLLAAGKAHDFMDGLLQAQQSISSGQAYNCLKELINRTQANG